MKKPTPTQSWTAEQVYRQFLPMARRMGGKAAAKFPLIARQDFDDEALNILADLAAQWNVEGERFHYTAVVAPSTWVYRNLNWRLLDFGRRGQMKEIPFTSMSNPGNTGLGHPANQTWSAVEGMPVRESWIESLLRNLGEDAKIIVETILLTPAEIAEDLADVAQGIREGRKDSKWWPFWAYLSRQGWDMERIRKAWLEVEVAL